MLNPNLYAALERKFRNAGGVLIANEGVKNEWRLAAHGESLRRELVFKGEQYRVCCPFCGDNRHRLYLNYEFGTTDIDGRTILYAASCLNEQCFQLIPAYRHAFFMEVLFGKPISKAFMRVSEGRKREEYVSPGDVIPLSKLDADHIAVQYLEGRGYDRNKLSYLYQVGWCASSTMRNVRSRIIIPVIFDGKEVGWMARLAQDGELTTVGGYTIPKYYNMPGFRRQTCLYNYDNAKHYKSIIIVEGALDCIRVGGPAVALLGKSISMQNAERLSALVHKTGGMLVVALDPDQSIAEQGTRHHIEIAADKLRSKLGKEHEKRVMPFYLPSGVDPGKLERVEFQRLLRSAAAEQNIELEF